METTSPISRSKAAPSPASKGPLHSTKLPAHWKCIMFEKQYRVLFSLFVLLVLYSAMQDRCCYAQQRAYVPVIPPKDTSMFWIFKDVTAGPYFTGGISRQNEKLPQQTIA